MPISVVNLVMDQVLPPELRDPHRVYNSKGVDKLMADIAKNYPDQYPKFTKLMGDIGRKQAWRRGETFTVQDFDPVIDRTPFWQELDRREAEIAAIEDPEERQDARADLYADMSARMQRETNTAALARRNNVAMSILTGARGKEPQLRDMLSTPGFYTDGRGRVIPGFVRSSFAEGLRPYEYLSGTFAAREAVTGSKKATAKGGFMAKTLSRALATHMITQPDCGTSNGLDIPVNEDDLRGRVLQRPVAGFEPGTVLDRKTLKKIRESGVKDVITRSPLTCQAEDGVCAKCYGVGAEGRFYPVGTHVGIKASTGLGEPITQAALSQKHVGSGKAKSKEYSGLDYLNQFMESPEEFKDRAGVAPKDGVVSSIRPAPQGGSFVTVGDKDVYVPIDRKVMVGVGDSLEAGDQITDGLLDVEDVINYKGLGEARRYWADRVGEMAKASNAGMDKRSFELLARAVVDHVELDDPVEEGFLPDDKVRYSKWMHVRSLPKNTAKIPVRSAVGKYLEQPALHHTVGTRISQSIANQLESKGWNDVFASDNEPGFRPKFIRLQQVAATDDDWLASLGGSYLGAQIREGVIRAQDTNIEENRHPVPRMAVGVGYADKLEQTGKF